MDAATGEEGRIGESVQVGIVTEDDGLLTEVARAVRRLSQAGRPCTLARLSSVTTVDRPTIVVWDTRVAQVEAMLRAGEARWRQLTHVIALGPAGALRAMVPAGQVDDVRPLEVGPEELETALQSGWRALSIRIGLAELRDILHAVQAVDQLSLGPVFLASMVQKIATLFEFAGVFVGRSEGQLERVTTVAVSDRGRPSGNFYYQLAETPCLEVLTGRRVCSWNERVAEQFPKDPILREWMIESYFGAPILRRDGSLLGLLVAMDTRPRSDVRIIAPVLEFFAGRAAAELERMEQAAIGEPHPAGESPAP